MAPARILCIVSARSEGYPVDGTAEKVCPAESIAAGLAVACRSLGLSTAAFEADISSCVQHRCSGSSNILADATGRDVLCISPWLAGCSAAGLQGFITQHAQGADIALVVSGSATGLHSPLPFLRQSLKSCCTTAQIARLLNAPCLLVVKAAAGAGLVSCVQKQLAPDPSLPLAGVIVQQTESSEQPSLIGLQSQLQNAALDVRVVGCIPGLHNCPDTSIPSMLRRHVDIDSILAACTTTTKQLAQPAKAGRLLNALTAKAAAALNGGLPAAPATAISAGDKPSVRIAVAQDDAFSPCFPGDLAALQAAGAVIEMFSPLHDQHLPSNCQGVLLGGMQELSTAEWHQLYANTSMRAQLKAFCDAGGVVLAQYTGLVYLSRAVAPDGQAAGHHIPLVGVLPFRALLQPSSLPAVEACVELTVTQTASHLLLPMQSSSSGGGSIKGGHGSGQQQQPLRAFLHSRVDLVEELRHSLGPWGAPALSKGTGDHGGSSTNGYSSAFSASAAADELTPSGSNGVTQPEQHSHVSSTQQPKRRQHQQQKWHTWQAGYCTGNVIASAMHWPFAANTAITEAWVAACGRVNTDAVHDKMSISLRTSVAAASPPNPSSPFKSMAGPSMKGDVQVDLQVDRKCSSLAPLYQPSTEHFIAPPSSVVKSMACVEVGSSPATAATEVLYEQRKTSIPRFNSCKDLSSVKPASETQVPWPSSVSMPGRLPHQAWAYDVHLMRQQQLQQSVPTAEAAPLTGSSRYLASPGHLLPQACDPQDHGSKPSGTLNRHSCILEAEESGSSATNTSCKVPSVTDAQLSGACDVAATVNSATGSQLQHSSACADTQASNDNTVHQASGKAVMVAGPWLVPESKHAPVSTRSSCEHDILQQHAAVAPHHAAPHHARSGSHSSMQGLYMGRPDSSLGAFAMSTPPSSNASHRVLSLNKSSSMYALSSLGPDSSTGGYWAANVQRTTDAIVSLCPGATEVLVALGLRGRLAGVTDACDWPENLKGTMPVACRHNRSSLMAAAVAAQAQPNAHNSANTGSQQWQAPGSARTDPSVDWQCSLLVDEDLLREERPSVVVLPDLDQLSMQDRAALHRSLHRTVLHPATAPHERAAVVSMGASTLAAMLQSILQIGDAAGASQAAYALVDRLRGRARHAARGAAARCKAASMAAASPRVLVLSALQPSLMLAGGCVPEMLSMLGGVQATFTQEKSSSSSSSGSHAAIQHALEPGEADTPLTWEQLLLLAPDVLVIMGGVMTETLAHLAQLAMQPGWWEVPAVRTGMVFIMQAPLLLRPGPRLIDGLEHLADILAHYQSACGPSKGQVALPIQPIQPAPGTWRTFMTGQGRDAARQSAIKGVTAACATVTNSVESVHPVLKLLLSGGQRCRPSLLPNYFLPWWGKDHARDAATSSGHL